VDGRGSSRRWRRNSWRTGSVRKVQAHAVHQPRICRQARRQARLTVRADRLVLRAAVLRYRIGIESARRTFWGTIHALRGGTGITPDLTRR